MRAPPARMSTRSSSARSMRANREPAWRGLNDLPDELWAELKIEFYSDPADGVLKALLE